jgi:hypothetical protein
MDTAASSLSPSLPTVPLPSSPPQVAETHHQLSPPVGDHLPPPLEDHPPTPVLGEGYPLPPALGEGHLLPSAREEDHPPLASGEDHPPSAPTHWCLGCNAIATALVVGPSSGMMALLGTMEANDVAPSGLALPKKNPILSPLVRYFDLGLFVAADKDEVC